MTIQENPLVDLLWQRFQLIDAEACKISLANQIVSSQGIMSDAQSQVELSSLRNQLSDLQERYEQLQLQLKQSRQSLSDSPNIVQGKDFSSSFLILLDHLTDDLDKGGYIVSCSGNDEECALIEQSISDGAKATRQSLLQSSSMIAQEIAAMSLIEEFKSDSANWISRLGIYASYSQVPFLIDSSRRTGFRIVRQKMMPIYSKLIEWLNMVGLKLIIPVPFLENLSDYSNQCMDVTGQAIGNMDYMCSDARARIMKVDKTNHFDMIFDIVSVGLCLNDEQILQAKVLL